MSAKLKAHGIYTTGEAAEMLGVFPKTVREWFDSGRIRGYRVPGTMERRIPREHLIRFADAHGITLKNLPPITEAPAMQGESP